MAFCKISLYGQIGDQQISNLFWYNSDATEFDPLTMGSAVVTEFLDTVLTPIRAIQHTEYKNVGIKVETPGSVEWYQESWELLGTSPIGGRLEAPFVAYGFQLIRSSGATKSGSKRIAGVPDTAYGAQDVTVVNNTAAVSAVATALAAELETGISGGMTFVPVIVRLDSETGSVLQFSLVQSARFRKITTQNSRKPRAN